MSANQAGIGWARKIQLFLVDLTLTIAGILSIAGGLWSVYHDSATMAATCMGAGLILLFSATLDRFELLKGFGVEAKMKKLDATITKAEVTLQQLKGIAEVNASAIVALSSRVGRAGGPIPLLEQNQLMSDLIATLKGVGSSPETIRKIISPWARAEARTFANRSVTTYRQFLTDKLNHQSTRFSEDTNTDTPATIEADTKAIQRTILALNTIFEGHSEPIPALLRQHIHESEQLTGTQPLQFLSDMQPYLTAAESLLNELKISNIDYWKENPIL